MTSTRLVEVLQEALPQLRLTQLWARSVLTQVVQLTIQLIVRVFSPSNPLSVEFQDLVRFFIQVQTKLLDLWRTQLQMCTHSSVRKSNNLTNLDIIQGPDQHDSNCVDFRNIGKIRYLDRLVNRDLEAPGILDGLRVGVLDEFNIDELDDRNREIQRMFIQMLKDRGAIIKRISVPLMKYCLPFYFTVVPSEAATNLSRFDGLKYGHQPDFLEGEDLMEYIERVRSDTLGLNVKRRVVLGKFLLSSKFEKYNDKVKTAQKVRSLFISQWCEQMEKNDIDVVISPTAIGEEPPLISNFTNKPAGSKTLNPVYEFKSDYYTAFPNSLGIPSITLPIQETWGKDPKTGERTSAYKFPSSVKICTYFGEDYHLLRIARQMEIMIEEAGVQGTAL